MKYVGNAAAALGGEVSGRDTILCPSPGHSPRDRSLSVKFDPAAPDGFLTFSHAGEDWRLCRDHVRERLGLPRWEPGDEQRRDVPPRHADKWDLAAIETEAAEGLRAWTEDEIIRIRPLVASGRRRKTLAARSPNNTSADHASSICPMISLAARCAITPTVPGGTRTLAR
jgi:hypothetical protein